PIFKADANARSVYVIDLLYDTIKKSLKIEPRLQPVTGALADDATVAKVVKEWVAKGFDGFRANGFRPEEVVAIPNEPLDGLEGSVRSHFTVLTDIIAQALLREAPDADLSVFNSGTIRIDDVIQPGPVTQYDVIRVMPFGNKVVEVEMSGDVLKRVLDQGRANKGIGGYLLYANVDFNPETRAWAVNGVAVDPGRTYKVATLDFLMSGRESGLGFLKYDTPGVRLIAEKRDMRFPVIEELKARFPARLSSRTQ
ncbi:MAG: 5'-nucleotidase C-terminal domain-containing protein, partial [bacterium]